MSSAIVAEHIAKQYRITDGAGQCDTLRDQIAGGVRRLFRRNSGKQGGPTTFWPLKDISFEIAEGQIVGIIGQNGAGKSTLLKILSRITQPTSGRAEVYGRVGSLLEVGTGFHPELSGRENIFLNGAIIGMQKEEISRLFDAIVDFAGVEAFIDMPVKRYSSGMYVRLAFAVSAHLKPEILMIDEVLSVGDLQFQRKCMAYVEELKKRGSTILFVSHNLFAVKAFCDRVIFLSEGLIRYDGSPAEAIRLYEEVHRTDALAWARTTIGSDPSEWDVFVDDVQILDEAGRHRKLFDYGERMRIRLAYTVRRPVANPSFLVSFIRSDNVACCNYNTVMDGVAVPLLDSDGVMELLTPPLKLVSESYQVYVLIRDDRFEELYCAHSGESFHVRHELLNTHFGVFHQEGTWQLQGSGTAFAPIHLPGGIAP